jgi:hypothetical protein
MQHYPIIIPMATRRAPMLTLCQTGVSQVSQVAETQKKDLTQNFQCADMALQAALLSGESSESSESTK